MGYLLFSHCFSGTTLLSCLFPLTSNARLLKMFLTAQLDQNAILLHLSIKPSEQTIKTLIFSSRYFSPIACIYGYSYNSNLKISPLQPLTFNEKKN